MWKDTGLGIVWENLSFGARLIILLAVLSSVGMCFISGVESGDLEFWVFARKHRDLYRPLVSEWNREHPEHTASLTLLDNTALRRRLMAGIFGNVPTADLVEVERGNVSALFAGPPDAIGLMDLTDHIVSEGLDDEILPASFLPWTRGGRIYGLPHDVHPVLLAYRRDLVEEAGIDLSKVETWDQFFQAMSPLMADRDGNGDPDRYLIDLSLTDAATLEALLLQAGGGLFTDQAEPFFNRSENRFVLSRMVRWTDGPSKVAVEAPEFSASGNRLKLEGFVAAALMPDWRCSVWELDLPGLSGTLGLMPLPAFRPGGRRTTVLGGTMLAIPKAGEDPDRAWELAKHLYLSRETAVQMFEETGIISPVSRYWDDPVYDAASPYFNGQAPGRLYIEAAADVPPRYTHSLHPFALERLKDAALELRSIAREVQNYDPEFLEQEAGPLLEKAEAAVRRQMRRSSIWEEGT